MQTINNRRIKTIAYWIKFTTAGNDLRDPNSASGGSTAYEPLYLADGRLAEFFSPKKRPGSMKANDVLYIAYLSYLSYKPTQRTPIIVAKAKTHDFSSANEVSSLDIQKNDSWMEYWRYYIELEDLQTVKGNISNGIPVIELLKELKNNFYDTPVGRNPLSSIDKLKTLHRQQSHMHITSQAAKVIDERLGFK